MQPGTIQPGTSSSPDQGPRTAARPAALPNLPHLAGLSPLTGRTALVTGGTGGIGLPTAAGLARLGARVLVTGRNPARGAEAVSGLRELTGNPHVDLLLADLSTLDGVHALADAVAADPAGLDLLVNNAGALPTARAVTTDGYELALAVNHLAPFLLTARLLPALRVSAGRGVPARVVNLTSSVTRLSRSNELEDLNGERDTKAMSSYGRAKLASLVTTTEWARRLDGTGVVVHAADPGGADTAMTRGMRQGTGGLARVLLAVVGPSRRTATTAARSPLVAAADPALGQVTGRVVGVRGRPGHPPRRTGDPATVARLWDTTAELVGLDPSELPPIGPAAT